MSEREILLAMSRRDAVGRDADREPATTERVKALYAEYGDGHTCPKCGRAMTHYRTKGYLCAACD